MGRKKSSIAGPLFLIAAALTLLISFVSFIAEMPGITYVSLAIGFVIGLMNVTKKESVKYLLAAIAVPAGLTFLMAAAELGMVGDLLQTVAMNFIYMLAPTTIFVGGRALYHVLRN